MKRNHIIKTLLAVAAVAVLTGCFKDVSNKTTYVLKPFQQLTSGDILTVIPGVKAFAYDADTTKWTVISYEDALNGVLTSKFSPADKITEPIAVAEPYEREGTEGWLQMGLTKEWNMILAVDPVNKLYAYTQYQSGQNLPFTYVTLIFKPYKEGFAYQEGGWSFYNEFYTPPKELATTLTPKIQAEENGAETDPTSSQIKAYAFAADTTLWYIASYEDAAAGVITSKNDPNQTRTNPNFNVFFENGTYKMTVTNSPLMVVVVNKTDQLYAYSKQVVDLEGEPVDFPIVFRTWKKTYLYVEDGWRVVDYSLKPEPPVDPDDPLNPTSKRLNR